MSDLDQAYAQFKLVVGEYRETDLSDETETEVRSRLIDRLLFECLGWPRDARQELQVDADRTDYLLRDSEHRNWVIVEAKRPGYELARSDGTGKAGTKLFKLSGAALSFATKGAWPVFRDQVARYATQHGTSVGIATNGAQWVGAPVPSRSGAAMEKDRAVIFSSLDAINDQFELFFNFFSLDGVRARYLEHRVLGERAWSVVRTDRVYHVVPPSYVKPISRSSDDLFRELERALDIAFRQVEDDPNVVEHTFVETRESRDADDRLARLTELLTEHVTHDATHYESRLRDERGRVREEGAKLRPGTGTLALLTGELSSGKTTYLRRFFNHVLPRKMRKDIRFAHVRFDQQADLYDQQAVFRAIAEALEDEVFSIDGDPRGQLFDLYAREWRKHQSLFGDSESSKSDFVREMRIERAERPLDYAIRLARICVDRHNCLPCVALDGLDDRAPEIQKAALDAAVLLYRKSFSFVTVVMDDATVWRLHRRRDNEGLERYITLRLWLPRPMVGEVLRTRFAYLRRVFEGQAPKSGRASAPIGQGMRWTLDPNRVADFLRDGILFDSEWVRSTISSLANYDIRVVLELCRRVILSPTIRTEEVFKGFALGEFKGLRPGRVLRAIIKPRHRNFKANPDHCVHNIYSFHDDNQHCLLGPFLLLAMLNDRFSVDETNEEEVKGFIAIEEVATLADTGFLIPRPTTAKMLKWLWVRGLVQPYNPGSEIDAKANLRLKITPRGRLHLRWATRNWDYMREMGEVDAICDRSTYELMCDASKRFHSGKSTRDEWYEASTQFAVSYIGYLTEPYASIATVGSKEWAGVYKWVDRLRARWVDQRKRRDAA